MVVRSSTGLLIVCLASAAGCPGGISPRTVGAADGAHLSWADIAARSEGTRPDGAKADAAKADGARADGARADAAKADTAAGSCAKSMTCSASTPCSATCTLDGPTKWCRSFDGGGHAWTTGAVCGDPAYPTGTTFTCAGDSSWPSGAGVCCPNANWQTTCTCANSVSCDANTPCEATCTLDGPTKWCRSFNGGAYAWTTEAVCGDPAYPTGTTFSCAGDPSWPSGAGVCCANGNWQTSC